MNPVYERVEEFAKVNLAFEIIKNKKVNVRCIMSGWNCGKYNSYKSHINLEEWEYNFLKEMLCQKK